MAAKGQIKKRRTPSAGVLRGKAAEACLAESASAQAAPVPPFKSFLTRAGPTSGKANAQPNSEKLPLKSPGSSNEGGREGHVSDEAIRLFKLAEKVIEKLKLQATADDSRAIYGVMCLNDVARVSTLALQDLWIDGDPYRKEMLGYFVFQGQFPILQQLEGARLARQEQLLK